MKSKSSATLLGLGPAALWRPLGTQQVHLNTHMLTSGMLLITLS